MRGLVTATLFFAVSSVSSRASAAPDRKAHIELGPLFMAHYVLPEPPPEPPPPGTILGGITSRGDLFVLPDFLVQAGGGLDVRIWKTVTIGLAARAAYPILDTYYGPFEAALILGFDPWRSGSENAKSVHTRCHMKTFTCVGVFMVTASLIGACKKDEPASPSASPSATATTTEAQAATPAPSSAAPPAAPASKPVEKVCPFPRRCDEACKKAHFAAMDPCRVEWKAIENSVPNIKEMGECTARCLKTENTTGCVGAENKAECDCIEKCQESVPVALRSKSDPYVRCYLNKVRGACF